MNAADEASLVAAKDNSIGKIWKLCLYINMRVTFPMFIILASRPSCRYGSLTVMKEEIWIIYL